MPSYQHVSVPKDGQPITVDANGRLQVPDCPIVPFLEGAGFGTVMIENLQKTTRSNP